MVRVALAAYTALLTAGLAGIVFGVSALVAGMDLRLFGLAIAGTAGYTSCLYALTGRIRWISRLNAWLDRRFFGILDRSNAILSGTIIASSPLSDAPAAGPGGQAAEPLTTRERHSLAQAVLQRLASEERLLRLLIESNVFGLWIWYWIFLYGSCAFTALTIALFASVAFTATLAAKTVFASLWALALAHIGSGFFLGNHLIGVTRSTATAIVSSYGSEIAAMLKQDAQQEQEKGRRSAEDQPEEAALRPEDPSLSRGA